MKPETAVRTARILIPVAIAIGVIGAIAGAWWTVATMARVPPKTVSKSDADVIAHIGRDLKRLVFGQDKAIEALSSAIKLARAGLREPEKPIGCYLFSGPTGVGKTEVAKQLANLMGVELLRFAPGQVICTQGEPADSFYLVRLGFVKVSQQHPGGDLVLAYLARGSYFGEMALLTGTPRTATCSALDHVEVVRVSGEDFQLMLDRFPEIRRRLEETAAEHIEQNRLSVTQVEEVSVDRLLNQGLMEAQSLLILDLDRCTRCDQCVRACADAHDGVSRLVRDGLRFDRYLVATSCRQCRDPLCMVGCPVGSIRRRNSLEVIIEDWCIGCGQCANNCPYGNINMHPFPIELDDPAYPGRRIAGMKLKATSCDLCLDHEAHSCVYACPHDAAHRVNPPEFFGGLLKQQTIRKPGK